MTRGDLPLSISWLKDGRSMGPSERVTITNMEQFSSILMIESLSPDHNGNYSCVARNMAAEVSHTQRLVVHGNPPLGPNNKPDTLAAQHFFRVWMHPHMNVFKPIISFESYTSYIYYIYYNVKRTLGSKWPKIYFIILRTLKNLFSFLQFCLNKFFIFQSLI